MKNSIVLILVCLAMLSCEKKETEPEIVRADEVVGAYVVLTLTIDDDTFDLPILFEDGSSVSLGLDIEAVSETSVDLVVTFITELNGNIQTESEIENNLELLKNNDESISLIRPNSNDVVAIVSGLEIGYLRTEGDDLYVYQGNKID